MNWNANKPLHLCAMMHIHRHVDARLFICICMHIDIAYVYVYIYSRMSVSVRVYKVHTIGFQTFFFVWALLLIVHTWNSSPLPINLLRLQCTCCIVPTTSGTPHGSPLVWACQWPSSQPLSSPQLSHNNCLWA